MNSICKFCGKEYDYKRNSGGRRTICPTCLTLRFRYQCKKKAVEYKGGKCQQCGYSRSIRALNFHHRDPQVKDFTFSRVSTWAWTKLQRELDKCDLLCANCHMETEEKISKDRRLVQW